MFYIQEGDSTKLSRRSYTGITRCLLGSQCGPNANLSEVWQKGLVAGGAQNTRGRSEHTEQRKHPQENMVDNGWFPVRF